MNFTSDIKKEIIAKGVGVKPFAAISAFLRTSGDVGMKDGAPTFYFVSETENVAEFFMSAFFEAFGVELFVTHATKDRMSGKAKLVIQCPSEASEKVAGKLGLINGKGGLREGIAPALLREEESKINYICGAFLGSGSCTVPMETRKTGYHLEFIFPNETLAQEFCDVLSEFELIAKVSARKENYVVYIKSKELISDFLAVIGAENALKKFTRLVEKRDKANNDNRARNCISGNADKTAIAAVKQVVAIEKLEKRGGLAELSEELCALARARLANPTMSLQELADRLCISKSCLNHRMRRLMELSERENKE